MKINTAPRILCVNPWIHDFAAYDFWAKPLGLLSLAALLRQAGAGVTVIDCLDRFHPSETRTPKILWDGRGPYRKTPIRTPPGLEGEKRVFSRYGIKPEWLEQDLLNLEQPDLVLVTSLMTYWAPGVAETIGAVKRIFPDVPVILGGVYASLLPEHARKHSGADQVVTGPGEALLNDLVRNATGWDPGIDPAIISDNADLDRQPFPALDLLSHLAYAPVLTSRGCPFSCEYCASSILEPRVRRRSAESVFQEICRWHTDFGVRNLAFYDDALLVSADQYAFPLFEKLIKAGLDLFFHTPNALHVRAITPGAARLMYKAGFKTIRLGLETADFSEKRQYDVKVRGASEFLRAAENLRDAGFNSNQLGAYLLCGLPGQDLDGVAASMALVRAAGMTPVLAYYTPIPGTTLWETACESARFDLEKDPVFTNNALFPCVPDARDRERILKLKH